MGGGGVEVGSGQDGRVVSGGVGVGRGRVVGWVVVGLGWVVVRW